MSGLVEGPCGGPFLVRRMNRVAVFVDAGYLFAQGSIALSGSRLQRREIELDHKAAADALKRFAESQSGLSVLRIYWYDGTSQGPTAQHTTLAGLRAAVRR